MLDIRSVERVDGIPRRTKIRLAHVAKDDPVVRGTEAVAPEIDEWPALWHVRHVGADGAVVTSPGRDQLLIRLGDAAEDAIEEGMELLAQTQVLRYMRKVDHIGEATIERILDHEREVDVDVPLLRVHCPRREGCSAEYTLAGGGSHEGGFELTIVGIGGGAGYKIAGTESETWEIEGGPHARCREVSMPGRVLIGDGVLKINGQIIREGRMGDVLSIDRNGREEREISPDADGCLVAFDQAMKRPQHWWADRLKEGKPTKKEVELERETSGTFNLGFEKPDVVQLKLEYSRTTSRKASISTTLAPGAKYGMYAPDTDTGMERCWTIA